MGTPEFAVASLDALVKAGCHIVAVVTAPDRPAGRGMLLQQSEVKKYAVAHQLHVLQPEKLRNPEFLEELRTLQADIQVVVAFRMLPEMVWNMPPMGTLNVHGSLLPQYRGAAPINWAVINGERQTGVTTFKLQQEIDTGDILLQQAMPIGEDENAGEVHDRMKELGAALLLKTIRGLAENSIQEKPQQLFTNEQGKTDFKHAPKIFTDTCKIDFSKTVNEVHDLVRGLAPYPAAFTFLQGKKLKIFKSAKTQEAITEPAGSVRSDGKTYLQFCCSNGWISVLDLQLEGKKRMLVADFLRGYRFE